MTDRYAVMGHPVAHSKSPFIHRCFAEQTGEKLVYEAIEVPEGSFREAVRRFQSEGGRGLNVTVPFKREAWALAARRTSRAERAGAVNTLWFDGDEPVGDNTDGVGLVNDLSNQGLEVGARRVLLLGAGGAARGVLPALLALEPAALVIANRTLSKAQALVEGAGAGAVLSACGFEGLRGRFELILNATSASLDAEVPPVPPGVVSQRTSCYDLMYAAEPTAFLRWAARHGARHCVDGLGMLVEQAAEAFTIWRGVRPETAPVLARLRQQMAAQNARANS